MPPAEWQLQCPQRTTKDYPNQGVFEEAECDTIIAFVVFRHTKAPSNRTTLDWTTGGGEWSQNPSTLLGLSVSQ